jgi:hypothetical protein
MQVAQVNDHITHAVIGGAEAIEFGISSSAEFFNILSSTLYKDQILAVVREVLCNAWDAHIEAGCMHIPVEITLTEDRFTIKDSGKGIHRDDMGLIYGTYGNSTKKNDGKQTGGFGLGCKAPFAYTDHFEVISCNDGVKTIYNLSKSSAAAMGKPGIVPIASFPTQETGLQVAIHINTPQDQQRFAGLIQRIVKNGDMHMTVNGELVEKLGFDTSKANYLLTRDTSVLDTPTTIMVRYGNVVYPVDVVIELRAQYIKINNHLAKLSTHSSDYRLIFQAPPHSISVTPSRESLSMQEHTLKTLQSLFDGFITMLDSGFTIACDKYAEGAVQQGVAAADISALLSRQKCLPGLSNMSGTPVTINTLEIMAQRYMSCNYPDSLSFRKKDIERRLGMMATAGLLDRGVVQTYLRDLREVTSNRTRETNSWLQRRIVAPLVTKLMAAGLDHTKLYALDPDNEGVETYRNMPLMTAASISPKHLFATLPYLRNIVVISTSRTEIHLRASKHDEFKKLGGYHGYLFYHASMKKVERETALAFFKVSNMVVIDLTIKQEQGVKAAITRTSNTTPRKPTKKGLVY